MDGLLGLPGGQTSWDFVVPGSHALWSAVGSAKRVERIEDAAARIHRGARKRGAFPSHLGHRPLGIAPRTVGVVPVEGRLRRSGDRCA